MEDLERLAGSSATPQTPAEIEFTPPMQSDDDGIFANKFEQDRSQTAPLFAYHTYPAPEDVYSTIQIPASVEGEDTLTTFDMTYQWPAVDKTSCMFCRNEAKAPVLRISELENIVRYYKEFGSGEERFLLVRC
jgi:hypothetical protein